jgi:hypothetical protein
MGPDDLTPAFFADLLGLPVAAVERQRIGTGQVGMNIRCTLTYASDVPDGAPATLVAKMPSSDEASRAAGVATRTYEREAKFYREVQPTVHVRTPRCYLAEWDPDTHDTLLVLEDLAPAEQGDQIAGCSLHQAAAAVTELARLHAPRWDDPALFDLDWLTRGDLDLRGAELQAFYQWCWPQFAAYYAASIPSELLLPGEHFGAGAARWLAVGVEPWTVTHNDYRLDNLLFATPAGGYPVAVVDWQTPSHGPCGTDLAYFVGAGLQVPERRAHEQELVEQYRSAMASEGVSVGADDLWDQYRWGIWHGVLMAVVSSTIVGHTERGDAMFVAMYTRHAQHAIDLQATTLL